MSMVALSLLRRTTIGACIHSAVKTGAPGGWVSTRTGPSVQARGRSSSSFPNASSASDEAL